MRETVDIKPKVQALNEIPEAGESVPNFGISGMRGDEVYSLIRFLRQFILSGFYSPGRVL